MKIGKNKNIIAEYKNNDIKAQKADIKTGQKTQDQKKKLVIALASLAAIGAAGIVIAANVKKGKLPQKLANIKFESGIAKDKSGHLFTGIINDTLKNGDLVQLTYKDGVIQSSARQGTKNLSKTYSYDALGNLTKITTQNDGNIFEFIKTKYGHIIKENSKLKKAFIRKNYEDIVSDFKNGKPVSSKFFSDHTQIKEKIYNYDANNNLTNVSVKNNYDRVLSETTFDKEKITIKNSNQSLGTRYTTTVTKGGNQEYGADLSVIKTTDMGMGSQSRYFKDGKIIYEERTTSLPVSKDSKCGYPPYSRVRQEGDCVTKEVFDYRQNPNQQGRLERVYESGARDRLISGEGFGSSSMELQQLDSNGNTIGYIKSEFLGETSSQSLGHGIVNRSDRVAVTNFDANHQKVYSYQTDNNYSDWSRYDWD